MDIPEFFNSNTSFISLLLRYFIDLVAMFVLTRLIYFSHYRRTDLFLSFFAFNSIIFFVTHMLNEVEMSTGAAFGLFAVFSMLRYRTEGISAKDMTYLFLSIALGLLTSVSGGSIWQIILICVIILSITFLMEGSWLMKREYSKVIHYDNIALLHEDKKPALIEDLKLRTGLDIKRVTIDEIDYLKDAGTVTVIYVDKNNG